MPAPKRTRARAQTPEEDPPSSDGPEQGEQGAAPQLQFNEPLSWTAGRAISVGELLRRLDALYKELVQMEQDEFDLESLRAVAKELGAQRLIAHKDRGVKANTACCLVEILRMFAPEAPYTQKELKVCPPSLQEKRNSLTSFDRRSTLCSSAK
jgi:sister chromatid cohesion protein PDS5